MDQDFVCFSTFVFDNPRCLSFARLILEVDGFPLVRLLGKFGAQFMHTQRTTSRMFVPIEIRILILLFVLLNGLPLHHTRGGIFSIFVYMENGSSCQNFNNNFPNFSGQHYQDESYHVHYGDRFPVSICNLMVPTTG